MSDSKSKGFIYNWSFLLLVILGLVFINIIGSIIYFRWDATEDKRYSLTEGTESYLSDESNFPNRLSIKIYLEGNLPAEIKRYKNAIEDKLKEFKQSDWKILKIIG